MGIVDLSVRSREPLIANWLDNAGYQDERQLQADSLPKIGVLYAAYRLRHSIRKAAALGQGCRRLIRSDRVCLEDASLEQGAQVAP